MLNIELSILPAETNVAGTSPRLLVALVNKTPLDEHLLEILTAATAREVKLLFSTDSSGDTYTYKSVISTEFYLPWTDAVPRLVERLRSFGFDATFASR